MDLALVFLIFDTQIDFYVIHDFTNELEHTFSARLEKQIFLLIKIFDFCSENKILFYKSTPRNMKMTSDFRWVMKRKTFISKIP